MGWQLRGFQLNSSTLSHILRVSSEFLNLEVFIRGCESELGKRAEWMDERGLKGEVYWLNCIHVGWIFKEKNMNDAFWVSPNVDIEETFLPLKQLQCCEIWGA